MSPPSRRGLCSLCLPNDLLNGLKEQEHPPTTCASLPRLLMSATQSALATASLGGGPTASRVAASLAHVIQLAFPAATRTAFIKIESDVHEELIRLADSARNVQVRC